MAPLSLRSPALQCTLVSPPSSPTFLPPHSASWDHFPDKLLAPKSSPRGLKIENRCTEGSFKEAVLPGCQAQSWGRGLGWSKEDLTLWGVARAPVGCILGWVRVKGPCSGQSQWSLQSVCLASCRGLPFQYSQTSAQNRCILCCLKSKYLEAEETKREKGKESRAGRALTKSSKAHGTSSFLKNVEAALGL